MHNTIEPVTVKEDSGDLCHALRKQCSYSMAVLEDPATEFSLPLLGVHILLTIFSNHTRMRVLEVEDSVLRIGMHSAFNVKQKAETRDGSGYRISCMWVPSRVLSKSVLC